jgi:hypothetical protein
VAGPWEKYQQPNLGRPIIQEAAPQPAPQTPAQRRKDELDAANIMQQMQERAQKMAEAREADKKLAQQKADAIDSNIQLINGVNRARKLVRESDHGIIGDTATGGWYDALTHVPWATNAKALEGVIEQDIRGNIFLKRIGDLRQENDSPNGGTGIGRIMQAEIPLFTGALGYLKPEAGRAGLEQSLTQIERASKRSVARLRGENPDDPRIVRKYHIPDLSAAPLQEEGHNALPDGWSIEEQK